MERTVKTTRRRADNRGKSGGIGEGRILLRSFAKINFSIDVGAPGEDGFHPVDMVMQQIGFHDNVVVCFHPDSRKPRGEHEIHIACNRPYLPVDQRNLAYRAAELMSSEAGSSVPGGVIEIRLHKMIPIAAGLAGGSGNAAAVIHALNVLWRRRMRLSQIMKLCAQLGSDVPFCAMGQACLNRCLPRVIREDRFASACARARGTGTELQPLQGLRMPAVIAKPRHGVSTAEVYRGIDSCTVTERPDNDRLIERMQSGDPKVYEDFVNVLECYTLNAYPDVADLKKRIEETDAGVVLMSGSGPTVFGLYDTLDKAKTACEKLRGDKIEAYWTETVTEPEKRP
ncbi:MAG: 4-(cytidine 5'-diphospho)-2-C-methyl-D-erythritol kinase [Eubacterium sp.]